MRPHFGDRHHVTMDNWFTSPKLMHDLRNRGTFATGTVIHSRKGMPNSFKHVRLPKRDTLVKSQGPLMAILYSDRRQVTLLTTAGSAKYVSFLQREIAKYVFFFILHFNQCLRFFRKGIYNTYFRRVYIIHIVLCSCS
jgi:hypothetical protein